MSPGFGPPQSAVRPNYPRLHLSSFHPKNEITNALSQNSPWPRHGVQRPVSQHCHFNIACCYTTCCAWALEFATCFAIFGLQMYWLSIYPSYSNLSYLIVFSPLLAYPILSYLICIYIYIHIHICFSLSLSLPASLSLSLSLSMSVSLSLSLSLCL